MGSKVCLNHKLDVLKYVYKISNDIDINNQIFDLINRDGVTNFFCNDDGSYSFSLINEEHKKVFILISDNYMFVSNNMDGIRQQIYYSICDGVKYIRVNNYSDIVSHDNHIKRSVNVEKIYDFDDSLIFENKVTNMVDLMGDDSRFTISKYVVDNEYVRINSVSYNNNPDMNRVNYYVLNDSCWERITEEEFNSRFVDKINKKGLQKKKSMI